MLKQTLIAAAMILAPISATAGGSVDLFYTDNNLDIQGAPSDSDGNGYGFRGQAELGKGFSMIAMHQQSKVKPALFVPSSNELSETRIGVSYKHQLNKQVSLTGSLENVQFDAELQGKNSGQGATLNGYAANVGISTAVIDKLNAYASPGYVNLGKLQGKTVRGYEYTVGASYDICNHWAGFAEYRAVRLNTDALANDTDIDNNTLRIGGRYTF